MLRRTSVSDARGDYVWWGFVGILVLLSLAFLPRAWALRSLYVDREVRRATQAALTQVADQQGWLLSDLAVIEVTVEQARVIHRHHHRGEDPERCYVIPLAHPQPMPCGA